MKTLKEITDWKEMINEVMWADCLEGIRIIPDNTVDLVLTDPPYELEFMGKSWDSTGIAFNVEIWKECLRVLKPGGHLLSFGGTRTYHRMAVAIEDAGFEIRDMIEWVYGCLSEDTEILTSNGWKMLYSVFEGDYVFACDYKNDMKLQLESVKQKFIYDYDEDAYHIKDTGYYNSELMETDHIVSKNHNVLVSESWAMDCYSNGEYPQKVFAEILYENVQKRKELGYKSEFHIPGLNGYIPCTIEKIPYKGKVWCVEVESGAFVARRKGKIFITGNSGFPKSLSISKAIDKMGIEPDIENKLNFEKKLAKHIREQREKNNISLKEMNKIFGYVAGCNWWESQNKNNFRYPNVKDWERLKTIIDVSSEYDNRIKIEAAIGEKIGESIRSTAGFSNEQVQRPWKEKVGEVYDITAPATEKSKQWEGWGTALKPAHEPICMARKPLGQQELDIAKNICYNIIEKGFITNSKIIWRINNVKSAEKQKTKQSSTPTQQQKMVVVSAEFVETKENESVGKKIQKLIENICESTVKKTAKKQTKELQNTTEQIEKEYSNLIKPIKENEKRTQSKNMGVNVSAVEKQTLSSLPLTTLEVEEDSTEKKSKMETSMSSLKSTDTQKTDTDYSAQTATSQWVCMDIVRTLKVSFEGKEYDFIELSDGSLVWNENLEPYRKQQKLNVAENVLKYGTGGINIDESRIGTEGGGTHCDNRDADGNYLGHNNAGKSTSGETIHAKETGEVMGRFPANLLHDNSEEVRECFPETKDTHKNEVRKFVSKKRGDGFLDALTQEGEHITRKSITDSGNASRFFKSIIYQAKASKSDRGEENNHATVKPSKLIEYLMKMCSKEGALILDPFMGSWTTAKVAKDLGRNFIGFDMVKEHCEIGEKRLEQEVLF